MGFSTSSNKYLLLHFKVMALLACINEVLQSLISLWKSGSLWNKTVCGSTVHNPIFDFAFKQKLIDWRSRTSDTMDFYPRVGKCSLLLSFILLNLLSCFIFSNVVIAEQQFLCSWYCSIWNVLEQYIPHYIYYIYQDLYLILNSQHNFWILRLKTRVAGGLFSATVCRYFAIFDF